MNKKVLVIGAGFAGLAATKKLAENPQLDVNLIDRENYHLFQPLLYQVATSGLSPADIAYPIRSIFKSSKNVQVILGSVSKVNLAEKLVTFEYGTLDYDYLIIATGSKPSYFGNTDWPLIAPSLKTLDDAIEIRRRILLAFEAAEYESEKSAREARLTFVIVGGGPTGVELAGAIKEIALKTVREDFRNIDTAAARVILIEGNERVLKTMDPSLSEAAKKQLEKLGVEVLVSSRVTNISKDYVMIGDMKIYCTNVFWAAGVQASPLIRESGIETDRSGHAIVNQDLSLPSYPNVFVIGDACTLTDPETLQPVPGVAQAALQQGDFAARIILNEIKYGTQQQRPAFHYQDKGTMATIGRAAAVAEVSGWRLKGFIAWCMWCFVHVLFLVGFKNRLSVILSWIWSYLAFKKGARLITNRKPIGLAQFKENFISYSGSE